ncbi:hypothetical protein U1Q18_028036 [Sarracenia purpurea var. burkii]
MRKKMEALDEETHKVHSALIKNLDKHFIKKTMKVHDKEGKKDEGTSKKEKGKGKGIVVKEPAALPKGSEKPRLESEKTRLEKLEESFQQRVLAEQAHQANIA